MSASLSVCETIDKAPMSDDLKIIDKSACDLNGNIVQTSPQPASPLQDELAKLKAKIAEQNSPTDVGDVKISVSLNEKEKCSSVDGDLAINQESKEYVSKLATEKTTEKLGNVSSNDDDLIEEKLDATDNEVALSVEDEEKEPNDGGISAAVSSGLEGTSDVSDTPLTDTTNKDDNEVTVNTKDTSPSKKKKLRVKVAPSGRNFNSGGQRYRNNRNSATIDRRDDNYNGQRYNNRQQSNGSTVPGALGGFIRSFQQNQNSGGNFRHPPMNGNNGGRFFKDAQVNGNYGPRGPRNGFSGSVGFQAPRPRFGSFRAPGFSNGGMGNRYNANNNRGNFHNGYQNDSFFKPNAPFPVPGTSVYSRLGSVGNGYEKETDRFDELIKTIDYNDNGNVINIKASLGQSALNKLKEQKSYNLRVRLPATTPLSVVKRVLCAKFYLTKMMTVAKYSTDRNAEFYQDGGSMFMENRSRKIDLMSQLPIEEIQLRCLNNPNLFLSESETLHTMLQRHHYLQRATPQGGEVMFVLR